MDILDIAIAKQLAGGGGGSGTDNYNDLSNLPKINDVTLSGNKSSSALGLQSEITSENKLDSDLIDDTDQDNKFVTSSEKNIWNAKQNAIDADHKLNADYVDDSTSTNKFVTASDKETWNAKQNAIDNSHKLSSDLVDDANHTNKFVTSTEKNTWNGKQNAIDSDHKLSSSLVSFSEAEAAAIASGIDSSKVGQISTNQSNILSVQDMVTANWTRSRNLFDYDGQGICTIYSGTGVTATKNYDGTLTINGTVSGTLIILLSEVDLSDLFANGLVISGCPGVGSLMLQQFASPYTNYAVDTGSGATISGKTAISRLLYYADSGTVLNNVVVKPMLCSAEDWAKTKEFQPYALPNYDLTYLQAEDRASLAEVVDSGAKNLSSFNSGSNRGFIVQNNPIDLKAGTYVVSFKTTATTGQTELTIGEAATPHTSVLFTNMPNTRLESTFTVTSTQSKFNLYTDATNSTITEFMICTKAAFGVTQKFVPYRKPYADALSVLDKRAPKGTDGTVSGGSMDDFDSGCVLCTPNVTGGPQQAFCYVRTRVYDSNCTLQQAFYPVDNTAYQRCKWSDTWSEWKQFVS